MGVSHAQARIQVSLSRTRASYYTTMSMFSVSGELHSVSVAPTTSMAIDGRFFICVARAESS